MRGRGFAGNVPSEPPLPAGGDNTKYLRGDKSWQVLSPSAVGLGNVPNVDATDRANHSGTQVASTISDLTEAVQDVAGAAIVAGTNMGVVYNDSTGTITLTATVAGAGVSLAGGSTVTSAAASNVVGVTIIQNDTTNNKVALQITNAATGNALKITQNGNASNSTSAGGALNITNTASTGAGLVVYSNQAAPTGHLIAARADNTGFNQACYYGTSGGDGHTASFFKTGYGTGTMGEEGTEVGAALTAVSSNPQFSCLNITGREIDHGTIKVSHQRHHVDLSDANGSAISIDLLKNSTGITQAQGIFMTSSDGAADQFTGLWMNIYDPKRTRFIFRIGYLGDFRFGNFQADQALPAGETNFVKLAAKDDKLTVIDRDSYQHDVVRSTVRPSDHGFLTWTYDPALAFGTASTVTAGTGQIIKLFVPCRMTVTNAHLYIANTPTSITGAYAALYNSAGTLIASTQSADQSAAWNAAPGLRTIPLGAQPVVPAGWCYLEWWFTQSTGTAPTFARTSGTAALHNLNQGTTVNSATSQRWSTGSAGLTTTAPGSIATFNSAGVAIWAALS